MTSSFSWLHISDLHMGQPGQKTLWPNLKQRLYEDLQAMHSESGPWNLVLFTGDLTQTGTREEYGMLTSELKELWQFFAGLGSTPTLLTVPGNHDLNRPPTHDLGTTFLRRWWDEPNVQRDMWEHSQGTLRTLVETAFVNYTDWVTAIASVVNSPVAHLKKGLLPGDFSASIETQIGPVGIVGLNSAWLQIDGADYEGKLLVDPAQVLSVTNDNVAQWVNQHKFTLLMTHHPVSWLAPSAKELWLADVNPSGLFDLHLCGHMHVQDAIAKAHGGGPLSRTMQAASLFGLEFIRGTISREHGYSVGRVTLGAVPEIRIWPRRAEVMRDGSRRVVPDTSQFLEPNNSYCLSYSSSAGIGHNLPTQEEPSQASLLSTSESAGQKLEKLRQYFVSNTAARSVRIVDQASCSAALNAKRMCWIQAEWGAGFDGFVAALQEYRSATNHHLYRLDLGAYTSKEDFFAATKQKYGSTFEALCDALSLVGPALLILDNIPALLESGESATGEIEQIVEVLKQYCPDIVVIAHTSHLSARARFPHVSLQPLDEAELKTYVLNHPSNNGGSLTADEISVLFQYTDGMPARIDAALDDLKIVTLSELAALNPDLVRLDTSASNNIPVAITKAVADLRDSADPSRQRSYDLLKSLSAFPQGETLERVKRFKSASEIFYPVHAHELITRSLIGATSQSASTLEVGPPAKLLTVPRPVRDHVRAQTSHDEIMEQTKRAASLYFGPKWAEGNIKHSLAERLRNPVASSAELANASAIIIRLINDAVSRSDRRSNKAALRIAAALIAELAAGDHFRTVVATCEALFREIENQDDPIFLRMKSSFGRSLRMLGKTERAKDVLLSIADESAPNDLKQRILLNLALTYQTLGQTQEAVRRANETIKIGSSTAAGLHARSIILEETVDDDRLDEVLRRHEARCRKKKAFAAANNLAIRRISKAERLTPDVEEALKDTLQSAVNDKDFYNGVRAITKKATLVMDGNQSITEGDKIRLISAYQYLYNERLRNMFNNCHNALYRVFSRAGDIDNICRLFRHSSLIWRLNDDEVRERSALESMLQQWPEITLNDRKGLEREGAYVRARSSSLLSLVSARNTNSDGDQPLELPRP